MIHSGENTNLASNRTDPINYQEYHPLEKFPEAGGLGVRE